MEDACSSVQLTAEHFHQKLASSVQQADVSGNTEVHSWTGSHDTEMNFLSAVK